MNFDAKHGTYRKFEITGAGVPERQKLQVAQLWQRPRELDQRFQVGGQFEAKLYTEALLFAPLRHDAIRLRIIW